MKNSKIKVFLTALPLILGLLVSFIFVMFVGVNELVEYVGVQNAYLLMFLAALLSGLSTFNSVPYYAVLLMLANAGVNPVILGITSAFGVMSGDSISYLIGRQGSSFIPHPLQPLFNGINHIAINRKHLFPLVCFLYGAFCPLSNDFITISAGAAKVTYLKVMIPLALGNLVFNIGLAFLAVYSYDWLSALVG